MYVPFWHFKLVAVVLPGVRLTKQKGEKNDENKNY
jgi:hypothetical protein